MLDLVFAASFMLILGASEAFLDDPCYVTTVSELQKDSPSVTLAVPPGCNTGQVDWHYPKGNLIFEAKLPSADSVLCIEESWATMIGSVTEITDGLNKPMSMPIKDAPSCSSQASRHLQVMLTAEDTQYYMTTFKYTIKKVL